MVHLFVCVDLVPERTHLSRRGRGDMRDGRISSARKYAPCNPFKTHCDIGGPCDEAEAPACADAGCIPRADT